MSGANIAIVAGTALGVCRALGMRRRWRPLFVGLTILAFVVLARPEPSVVRAAAMGLVALAGMASSRPRAGLAALAAALLTLLAWDPWLARSYGFALSVLATLGLLVLVGPFGARIDRLLPTRLRGWGGVLAVPFAAQLVCAPVVVLMQGSVSMVAVPANLLAAPFVAPATVAGVGVVLVSVLWPQLGTLLAWVAAAPALVIAQVARGAAALPHSNVPWAAGPVGAGSLAALTVLVLLAAPWLAHHGRRRPFAALGCLVLAFGVLVPTRDVAWPLPGWQLVMCDVGQGDAIVLSSAPGRAVLVDAGPDSALVSGCLDRLGVSALDAVVLTHFHADHVDGLPGVLGSRQVSEILTTPVADPPRQAAEVMHAARTAGVRVAPLYAGDTLQWGGMRARVWWPARVIRDGSIPNNASIVLSVESAGLRALLLGDVERESARQVLAALRREDVWPVHVLKVAHHGSANRDDRLYAQARPAVALLSVGADNDYGHPAPSTLTALHRIGAQVHRTDERGDVALRADQNGQVQVASRGR